MRRLFFDIETMANPEAVDLMPQPKAPMNLRDAEKIAQAIEEKKREMIENAALDADYGRIVSIGMSNGVTFVLLNEEVFPGANDSMSEQKMLERFWREFSNCDGRCVGYNILGFDLPYLLRRSMALGVKPSILPVTARYRTEPVTDLMMILYNWGSEKFKGLKQVAKLYGITNACEGMDGSMVKEMSVEDIIRYQKNDVQMVIDLYHKMNGVYFRQYFRQDWE